MTLADHEAPYTTGQMATMCGVHLRTVLRWIQSGRLAAYQLPGRGDHRIARSEVLRFLRQHNMPIPMQLAAPAPSPASPRHTILIIDDDLLMARAIARSLHRLHHRTVIASDGFSAGLLVPQLQPALVTLDLNMPGLNGIEVIRHLRNQPAWRELPIVVISAAAPDQLDAARVAGATAVLEKPLGPDMVCQTVAALIGPGDCRASTAAG